MSPMTEPSFKYRAFISYSHADRRWGDWLHRALETYRVPKRLVGTTHREGLVPARVFPIFRDREELPTSSSLSANIQQALEQSPFLIVICSPRSAKSRWVNEEILAFKRLGRESHIFPLIVDGEPNASDGKPGFASDMECFPPSLRFAIGEDGALSDRPTEPIAADARPGRDGRNHAKLKLLAGLLGVDFDALRLREHERQRRRLVVWLTASGAISLALLGLSAVALWQKREADTQRGIAVVNERNANEQRQLAVNNEHIAQEQRHRAEEKEREARERLAALYEERGRDELVKGQPGRAAPFLAAAYAENPARATVRFLLSRALATLGGQSTVLEGHLDTISLAASDPTGKWLATADVRGTVKLWDAKSGQPLQSFETKLPDEPQKLLFHERAGLLLVAGQGKIRLCDPMAGTVRVLTHGYSPIHDLAITADGATLVSVSERNLQGEDATVKVWNVATGAVVAAWSQGSKTYSARLSRDEKRLLTTADDGTACVWDLASREKLLELKHPQPPSNAIWSVAEDAIVTVGENSGPTTWNARTGEQTGAAAAGVGNPRVLEFNAAGDRLLLATTSQAGVMAWPPGKLMPLEDNLLAAHAHFSPDGQSVVVCPSWGLEVKVWSAETGQLLATLAGHAARPRDAIFSPDGHSIITTGTDRRGIVWAWEQLKSPPPLVSGFQQPVEAALFGAQGLLVAKPFGAAEVRAWRGETGAPTAALQHPVDDAAGWLNDGLAWSVSHGVPRVATGGPDKTARVWDFSRGALVQALPHPSRVTALDLSADGQRLVSSTGSDALLWEVDRAHLLRRLAGPFRGVAAVRLSPAGDCVVVASADALSAWETTTGAPRFSIPATGAAFKEVKFTPDGRRFVSVARDKYARLWEAADGLAVAALGPHSDPVKLFAISARGDIFATFGGSGIVFFWSAEGKLLSQWETPARLSPHALRFWPLDDLAAVSVSNEVYYVDARTGAELAKFAPHQNDVTSLDFSADGAWLLTASEDRTLRQWPVALAVGTPAEVQARLQAVGSWELVRGQLVPRSRGGK